MEWYFASDGDDLVVPKDREPVDRLPSPNSWSDWGISEYEKKNFDEENFCEEVEHDISRQEMECSSNSSMSYGFHNNLQQWAALNQRHSDYQLCDLSRMDQMDDIYLESLLDEDLASENLYGSSSFSTTSQYNMTSDANISIDRKPESERFPILSNGFGGSHSTKKRAFSPTADWTGQVTDSFHSVEAPVLKGPVAPEHDNETDYMHEQTSLEESVLQELEQVTAKLNLKTRNCFRDSLYRLAENSKKQTFLVQDGDLVVEKHSAQTVHEETSRVGEREARESKTNAIDRAIANLMFSKMDLYTEEETPAAESLSLKKEGQYQYSSDEPWASCFTMFVGDAEVPIVGK